jgi:uncharacterized protein (DUF2141 family)
MLWPRNLRHAGGRPRGRGWAVCLIGTLMTSARAQSEPTRETPARFPLTVQINQLRNAKGRVAVALFASAADFPNQAHALRGSLAKITDGRARVVFDAVPPGIYAVAVLHDENANAKMDFNFLGMPLEGYGFSNDASGILGPPSFQAAAFTLLPRASTLSIEVRYFGL